MGKSSFKLLTFEERKQIEYYLSLGITFKNIAIRIGRSKNGVYTEYTRNKREDGTYNAEEAQAKTEKRIIEVNKKKSERNKARFYGSYLPTSEVEEILRLTKLGKSVRGIAEEVGRSKNTVLKIVNSYGSPPGISDLIERIEILEMQIQILTETINNGIKQ